MAGGKHIRAVGQSASDKAQTHENTATNFVADSEAMDLTDAVEMDDAVDLPGYDWDTEAEIGQTRPRFAWVLPAIAINAALGWSGFYGWAKQDQFLNAVSLTPSEWTSLLVDWSVPTLLIGVAWLLFMRNSRAETLRFADSAALLSRESRELETRLTHVNRELSLAREFLGSQSLELESLGRVASERISTHASTLQDLIKDNGAQVDAIGSASESALANMKRLRDDLPVIANSARDVSNQVGAAGRGAHDNLDKLIAGFDRLNAFGKASETQVANFEGRVGKILTTLQDQLHQIETSSGSRLAAVQDQTQSYRSEVEAAESAALDALQARVTALQSEASVMGEALRDAEAQAMQQLETSKERFTQQMQASIADLDETDAKAIALAQARVDELNQKVATFTEQLESRDRQFNEQIARIQEQFSTNEAQASEVLAQRLADLDDALGERREAQNAETEKLVAHSQGMAQQIETLTELIAQAQSEGETARSVVSAGLETLDGQIEEKREQLRSTQEEIAELTEAGVRLLEIIQSSASFSREDLPQAMNSALATLGDVEARAEEVSTLMLASNEKAQALSDYLIEARGKVDENDESLDALHAKVTAQSEEALSQINGLRSGLAQLAQHSENVAGKASEGLTASIAKLEAATKEVFETLDTGTREKVDALADSVSERAVAEIERALRNNSAEAVGKLEQAAAHASGVGREATMQLRDQLAKVNELTVNLEQRISRARELAEEQVNNDFARRMALITDSLNSSAIDLTSALSQEISDTSWDAYLKGDRGIFTRRAVRLIDSGEAREIADLYQSDDEFKANVSRYIHDFEAMLRSVLSTRDGKALGVTVLGSDVGKLYVVLAQSIERLRQ